MSSEPTPDPSEIHPEHDELTPANADDWTDEQAERYRAAKDAALEADATQNRQELARDEREALEALREATSSDEPLTETVKLAGVDLLVTKRINGRVEECFDEITAETQKDVPSIKRVKDEMIDAILELIVDDPEPEDDPITFRSREVWEQYYQERGSEGLMEAFEQIAEPALDRYENLGNSRKRTRQ